MCHGLNNERYQHHSEYVVLLLHVSFKTGLIVCAHDQVLEGATDGVVLSLSKVCLLLACEHPVS